MATTNYEFKRKSESFLHWMHDIKNERYFEAQQIEEDYDINGR